MLLPVDWVRYGLLVFKAASLAFIWLYKVIVYSHERTIIKSIKIYGMYEAYIPVNFLRICARDCKYEKKMEQNYLNDLAFAMVILRTKDVGPTLFQMLFWKSDISFYIAVGLMNIWTKNLSYSRENRYPNLGGLNQLLPTFQNSCEKWSIWSKNYFLYPKDFFFKRKRKIFW